MAIIADYFSKQRPSLAHREPSLHQPSATKRPASSYLALFSLLRKQWATVSR